MQAGLEAPRSTGAAIALKLTGLLAALTLLSCASPALQGARADGPLAPVASDFNARVSHVPPGLEAKIVDGYLQLWLSVPPRASAIVLDYEGAPWLRYNRDGVAVNTNSEEYYLSQTPVPAAPPPGLTRATPPRWVKVSSGHAHVWREGRLHSLTAVALSPGSSVVGRWTIRMYLDGRPAAISGEVFHRGAPSILWFWPIAVLLACATAAWRLHDATLDDKLARSLGLTLLGATALAAAAKYLHGRPAVAAGGLAILGVIAAAAALASWRLLTARSSYPLLLAIGFAALWAGLTLAPALFNGYVLLALPAPLVRADAALLLGGGIALIPLALRTLERGWARDRSRREARVAA